MDTRDFDRLARRIFTVTSRRSIVAGLAGVLAMLTALLTNSAAAQRRRKKKRCRAVGRRCRPGQRPGCCGKSVCRRGRCRCGKNQKPCHGRCINKKRRCNCPGGQTRCGGKCVTIRSSNEHCGACGNTCAGTATCQFGACVAGGVYRYAGEWAGKVGDRVLTPYGIAVDQAGRLYVTDRQVDGNVWVFSAPDQVHEIWPDIGLNPAGIDVGPDGTVFVTDYANQLMTFASDGTPELTIETLDGPYGVAVGLNGESYVPAAVSNAVQRFAADGTLLATWQGQSYNFDEPVGVATTPTGDVYVTKMGTIKGVSWLSADGTPLDEWNSWAGPAPSSFSQPAGITVDAAGYVYVVDAGHGLIQKFAANNAHVGTFGTVGGQTVFSQAVDIAVDRTGMVYVTDSVTRMIAQFRPA